MNLKTLGILTIIAVILFPIISPFPAILLMITMVFVYLSQIKGPEQGLNVPSIVALGKNEETIEEQIEEKENEIIIEDLGDKIVIREKKTIVKKDMTFEDSRKYNLRNVNCIKDCISFEAPKVKNHYKEGHKHCIMCNVWMIVDDRNCPCCSSELRTKEIKE